MHDSLAQVVCLLNYCCVLFFLYWHRVDSLHYWLIACIQMLLQTIGTSKLNVFNHRFELCIHTLKERKIINICINAFIYLIVSHFVWLYANVWENSVQLLSWSVLRTLAEWHNRTATMFKTPLHECIVLPFNVTALLCRNNWKREKNKEMWQ